MDQIQMIKGAVALIQPSLFEGDPGGCSVYNANSLMVPSIMADIRVNNEVEDSELIRHFEAKNELDLANKMVDILARSGLKKIGNEVDAHNHANIEKLCSFYISMIDEVIRNYEGIGDYI